MARKAGQRRDPTVCAVLRYYRHGHVEERVIDKMRIDRALVPIRAFFGRNKRVTEITCADVLGYTRDRRAGRVETLDAQGRPQRRVVQDGTIRVELTYLTAAISKAIEAKKFPDLLKQTAPRIELPPEAEPKDRWLTQEELARLFAAAEGRAYRFCRLAYFTASRKRAIETLRRRQVDLATRMIHLNPPGRRQTRKRRPSVPIADALLPEITAWCNGLGFDAFVIGGTGNNIRKVFMTAVRRAGLDPAEVTPHTLRHTRATHMARRGVSMWAIAGVLGDTVQTVTRKYLHHSPEHLRVAVNA